MTATGPLVQFARYVNGEIELCQGHTDQISYLAISHVWGAIDWRHVKGVPHEIKASEKKAKFIEDQLRNLVGNELFWMDTITVNQRDQAEVISTVQAIPAIFRDASRTIAVREGDGLYACCRDATESFTSWNDFMEMMSGHAEQHCDHVFEESYLLRLWTLQECQLSHTIQFVVAQNEIEYEDVPGSHEPPDTYKYLRKYQRVQDSLYVLAYTFDQNTSKIEEFIRAYITEGIVTRSYTLQPRSRDENIYTDEFYYMHLASNRSATEPRDYIFATMPQFPWYHYPADAGQMSFNAIFQDFYAQCSRAGHTFANRITRSMIDPTMSFSADSAWLPSNDQPLPTCLGDFLKLLGERVDTSIDANHQYSIVAVNALTNAVDFDSTVATVEFSMAFSNRTWMESHVSGELCRHGGIPEPIDQQKIDLEQDFSWLQKQAMRILDLKWCTADETRVNLAMRSDWENISREISLQWSPMLQQTVLLHAAMVSCQLPLSAGEWASARFLPVSIKFRDLTVLGLLSKHAFDESQQQNTMEMICAGRHTADMPLGRDLVLVHKETKFPVGLVPDFLTHVRTDEEYLDRMKELYQS